MMRGMRVSLAIRLVELISLSSFLFIFLSVTLDSTVHLQHCLVFSILVHTAVWMKRSYVEDPQTPSLQSLISSSFHPPALLNFCPSFFRFGVYIQNSFQGLLFDPDFMWLCVLVYDFMWEVMLCLSASVKCSSDSTRNLCFGHTETLFFFFWCPYLQRDIDSNHEDRERGAVCQWQFDKLLSSRQLHVWSMFNYGCLSDEAVFSSCML